MGTGEELILERVFIIAVSYGRHDIQLLFEEQMLRHAWTQNIRRYGKWREFNVSGVRYSWTHIDLKPATIHVWKFVLCSNFFSANGSK